MAISWFTALKAIPWGTVKEVAPYVVQGANKLWNEVRKNEEEPDARASVEEQLSSHDTGLAELAAQTRRLEARVEELQRQQLSSSELIQSLAQQNAQLVQVVDALRAGYRRAFIAIGVLAACLAGSVAWLLLLR